MISSDKNSELERQRLLIAMNTRDDGSDSVTPGGSLPYDPDNAPDDDPSVTVLAPNYLDNSDFDFSKDSYVNNPTVGGDAALELYDWYRQRSIKVTDLVAVAGSPTVNSASGPFKAAYTYPMDFVLLNGTAGGAAKVGTLTRVSDTQATLSVNADNNIPSGGTLWFGETLAESSARALKTVGHSLYAANEGSNSKIPRWDATNGWIELGSDTADKYDVSQPLPFNLVRGGLTFWFRCIVSLRSGAAIGDPVRISAGLYDATAAQQRFIESSNLTLEGAAVGTVGATSYDYVIIADLDDGRTIQSNVKTVANGNAVLSAINYIRLTWTNTTGVINYRIYRKVGGVTKRIFTIRNGAHDYNDYGTDEGETLGALPSSGELRPIAYNVSSLFNPVADSWAAVLIKLEIPSTYNTSLTTGKQWLRIAIEGACGSERMVLIDRISLSTSDGGWQRSGRDVNKILNQSPSSNPTTTTQGGIGVQDCFVLDTPVVRCNMLGNNAFETDIGEIQPGDFVLDAGRVRKVIKVRDALTDTIVRCSLSNGVFWECSRSERFITSRADTRGTRIDTLTHGDTISSWQRWRLKQPYIKSYQILYLKEPVTVRTLSLKGGRTFMVGRLTGWRNAAEKARNLVRRLFGKPPLYTKAIAHNRKADDFGDIFF